MKNCEKKLGNMITTYKRAKDRCRSTGEGKVTWEYYKVGVLFVSKFEIEFTAESLGLHLK